MAESVDKPRRISLGLLARWCGRLALAASLVFIAERLWRLDWSALQPHASLELAVVLIAAGTLFVIADHALAWAWAAMADPEQKLNRADVWRIYGQGVLAKYLPGSVFQYAGRQLGGAAAGLAHGRLARSSMAEVGLHLVASLTVAAICLMLAFFPVGAVLAAAILISGCLAFRGSVFTALSFQLAAFAGFALAAVLIGAAILPAGASLPHFAALFLLAWFAGFVVPIAPGGLGVREAALLALAGGTVPAASLLAATLALRVASIAGDVAYGASGLRAGRARPTPP